MTLALITITSYSFTLHQVSPQKPAVQQQCDPNIIVRRDRALAPFADNVDPFDENFDDVFAEGTTTEEEDLLVSFYHYYYYHYIYYLLTHTNRAVLTLIACVLS